MEFPEIKSVSAIGKYKLFIQFSDLTEGEYDLSDMAGKGVFKSWDTNNNFLKVSVNPDSGAIKWRGD